MLFALFLPTVLQHHFNMGIKPLIIPQFPLKKKKNNRSNNVDFFALSEDGKEGFLLELKTDMGSISEEQKRYLGRAKCRGMREILEDLKSVVHASKEKQKYYYLLKALSDLCLINLPDTLEDTVYPDDPQEVNNREVNELGRKICILKTPCKLEVVYIQPREYENPKDKIIRFRYIYFNELADIVESQGNMGGLFAGYLRKWEKDPANHPPQ